MAQSDCAWCANVGLEKRTIQQTELIRSFVSVPWFRHGHCLVIPLRHVASVDELTTQEASEVLLEAGRLGKLLDVGFGKGIMQKDDPIQPRNGVKMDHLHFHVFPRRKKEDGLFPTPYPNQFSAFHKPTDKEVADLIKRLRP